MIKIKGEGKLTNFKMLANHKGVKRQSKGYALIKDDNGRKESCMQGCKKTIKERDEMAIEEENDNLSSVQFHRDIVEKM